MAIVVQCPGCGVSSPAADSFSGRSVKCKKCGQPFVARPTLDGGSQSDTKRSQPTAADNPFPTLPAEFGRYRVLKLLGRGGMGAVYLAEDTQLRRRVALKIPFFAAGESPQRVERFVREAQSAAGLSHPNICTVFDAGRIGGRPFISMAHLAGASLESQIDPDTPMPQPRAAEIARKIALALDHAHEKGIVHRDLKPANVMLDGKGEPVVMDFGLAKRGAGVDENEVKLTREGGLLGTPSYMSPEQARGELARVGPATDIYALGVILFEMLAGRPPYVGSLPVLMGKILTAPVPPVREFRADVDPRLDAICQRAMAKEPAARFASMAEFADALGHYLTAEATTSVELVEKPAAAFYPPPVPAYYPPPAAPPHPAPARPEPRSARSDFDELDRPTPKKRKQAKKPAGGWLVLAGVAVLLLGGVGAWVGGVFKVKTKEGVIELTDLPADADVYVDGEKVTVTWDKGMQSAVVRVKPGTHKVEVKRDGVTAFGEDVTLEDQGRKVLTAKLTKSVAKEPLAAVVEPSKPPVVAVEPPPPEKPDGFVPLFNGKDLTGWTLFDYSRDTEDSGKSIWSFDPKSGVLSASELEKQDVMTAAKYKDFILKLEWRYKPGGKIRPNGAGIMVRSDGLKTQNGGNRKGIEIDLRPDSNADKQCGPGCFIGFETSLTNHKRKADGLEVRNLGTIRNPNLKPDSQWNQCEIACEGPRIKVWMDGVLVNEGWDCSAADGYILLRTDLTDVEFRNVQLKNLSKPITTPAKAGGFVPLFNGKDLTGWKVDGGNANQWSVKDGVIRATSDSLPNRSYLLSDASYSDFTFRFDFQFPGVGTQGGVALRAEPGENMPLKPNQFVFDHPIVKLTMTNPIWPAYDSTGSAHWLHITTPFTPPKNKPTIVVGKWHTAEVTVRGETCSTSIDGKPVFDISLDRNAASPKDFVPGLKRAKGRVGFLVNYGELLYRNIEIKELAGDPGVGQANPPAKIDPFQENSVWVSDGGSENVLTVTERKGDKFKARFLIGQGISRDVTGTVKDGKLVWLAKDVIAVRGRPGADNYGTLATDVKGERIDFVYKAGNAVQGNFTLRLQVGK